ncbi:hypothetical protein HY497_02495 [Candidatus Woesearchaeota archaeon]|nr:hypothetical protein [Candidatus Woesearchaeota archaeon]
MKHNIQITILLLSVFFLAQLIGLVIVHSYIDVEETQEAGTVVFEDLPLGVERPHVEEQTSFVYILTAVLVGTLFLFILMKFKIYLLWKAWYFLAVFISLVMAFGAFISSLWAVILSLVLALWKIVRPNIFIHNISELFIYGGLAAIFAPIMNVFAGVMLLIFISLYDMYAVWKSKHMIKLAKFQSKNNVFAGFYVPYQLQNGLTKARRTKKKVKSAILGGGDVAFPLLFAGTVLKEFGLMLSIIIPICATIALFFLLIKGKKNTFYPAMPFISAGCLVGYGIIAIVAAM